MIWTAVHAALACVCVVGIGAAITREAVPAARRRRHERCLARIVQLEIDLGMRQPPRAATRLSSIYAAAVAEQRQQAAAAAAARYTEPRRRLGYCEACRQVVALNAGRCQTPDRRCAKTVYLSEQATKGKVT